MTDAPWQLGGWTMLHFLWLGAIVAALGAAMRLACRRAAPNVRYAISLATLIAMAASPAFIVAWLAVYSPAILAGRAALLATASPSDENSPSQVSTGDSPRRDGSAIYGPPGVIDLAREEAAIAMHSPISPPIEHNGAALAAGQPANPSPNPSAPRPLFDLQARGIEAASVVAWLPWGWIIGAPITFALLATGLVGSERLRRKSRLLTEGPAFEACARLRTAMRIARRVSVAACDGLAQPVLIGIFRPLILLPASALSGWTPAELEMVLVHELAHVRRWDNLVNLVQRIIESLLFFHPAVWLVSRQVRRDREECCDATVVARTAKPQAYAELLVSIAAKMQAPRTTTLVTASAMADHPLAGRIRRILKLEDEPMWITRRTLAAVASLIVASVAALSFFTAGAAEPQEAQNNEKTVSPNGVIKTAKANNAESPIETGVFAEFPAGTNPSEIDKRIKELEKAGHAISIHTNVDGRTRIVDATAWEITSPHGPLRRTPSVKRAFEAFHLKHARASMVTLNLEEYFEKEVTEENPNRLQFIWDADGNSIVVKNATEEQLATIRELIQLYDQPTAKAGSDGRLDGLREKIKQMLPLFEPREDNPLKTVVYRYDNARPEFVDHWHYIIGGLSERPRDRKFTFNWNRHADHLEITAPAAAHEQLFKPAFSGVHFQARESAERRLQPGDRVLVDVVGEFPEQPIHGVYTIEPMGTVPLGATYGRAKIAGMTVLEAEAAVEKHLQEILTDAAVQLTLGNVQEKLPPTQLPPLEEPTQGVIPVVATVVQPPTSKGDTTTAFLKLGMVWNRDNTAPQIERAWMNQLALVESSKVLIEALTSVAGEPEPDEVAQLVARLEASFPGDGEIMELVLTANDTTPEEDRTILQAIIDAYLQITRQQAEASGAPTRADQPASAPEKNGTERSAHPTYLYDGKTFDQWRDLWKYELKTERRIEAINALAAFARAGYGRAAAEAILDVAGQYDFTTIGGPGEGQLTERVTQVLVLGSESGVPATDWLPPLLERLAKNPQKWRSLAKMLLSGFFPGNAPKLETATRELLLQTAREPKYGLHDAALYALWHGTPEDDAEVRRLVRESLGGEDVGKALAMLRYTSFQELDQLPEQFDLLFHDDAAVRRTARTILSYTPSEARQDVADRLLAVLDDAERASDHADAIRALGVLIKNNVNLYGVTQRWTDQEARQAARDRLEQIVASGRAELVAPALVALGVDNVEILDNAIKQGAWDKSEEFTERVKQARDEIEAEAKRVDDQPPGQGGGMEGGPGGRGF